MNETGWFKRAIIYHILIDRFSGCKTYKNSPDFLGGNLNGIIDKIDYLTYLGINAIWLSPFYETNQYHGYHITNYKKVDPHFGSLDDLKTLIEEAHKRSIRIIADFVPNHCSKHHPFFEDARKNKNSLYRNWFYFKNWTDDYLCFLDVKELPKLNLENPATRDYIIDAAKYWLSLGIDGYRIDHILGPSHKFWKIFYKEIKSAYPHVVLFGEAWGEGMNRKQYETLNFKHKFWRKIFGVKQEDLQMEYIGEMDGILDFRLNRLILEGIKKGKDFASTDEFKTKVKDHLNKYPENYLPVTFLDNHDMNRFLFHCNGDLEILLAALEFLLSLNKPLILYYGTENGMYNKFPVTINQFHSDLLVREPFDWNNIHIGLYIKIRKLFRKNHQKV